MPEIENGRSFVEVAFYLAFLSQILLVSYFFPRGILNRMRYVIEKYPPSAYPKLYPKPIEYYEDRRRNYRLMNGFVLVAGLAILGALLVYPRVIGDFPVEFFYFMLQALPVLYLDLSSIKCFKLMRHANSTRRADLRPRSLLDFVSPIWLGMALVVYVAFVLFVIYVRQFGFDWFGGYWNVVIVTAMNLFFAGIAAWFVYGKKLDPHQAPEDRRLQIETLVRVLVFVSIAATVFSAISITLSALDSRNLQPIAQSLYFQLLAVISLQSYRTVNTTDFDVYKEDRAMA